MLFLGFIIGCTDNFVNCPLRFALINILLLLWFRLFVILIHCSHSVEHGSSSVEAD